MNQRENFFAMIEGKKPEFIPNGIELYKLCVFGSDRADAPFRGGLDPFGVNWIATSEGMIPEPNNFMFDDIADWKQYVKFPVMNSLGIEEAARIEMADVDREKKVINVFSATGLFERLAAFMGFENTLCSLVEDPDSCREFFEAFADYKIDCHNRFIDAYRI